MGATVRVMHDFTTFTTQYASLRVWPLLNIFAALTSLQHSLSLLHWGCSADFDLLL